MKTSISKLVIASILSITLLALNHAVPHLSQSYRIYRSEKMTQAHSVQEMPSGSYNTMIETLYASSWR
jgi:hypothetical protein